MKNRLICVFFCLAVFARIVSAQQRNPPKPSAPIPPRFQLVQVSLDRQNGSSNQVATYHELFLLDTQTGKLWHYQPDLILKGDGKNTSFSPEMLVPVKVAPESVY